MAKTITITIPDCSGIEEKARIKAAEKVASLPLDDVSRISELAHSNKALAALKSKWKMLKLMFT